ncbi:MAG: ABC transporter ATP-binding protein [Synergistaceae bacterium]|jgi:NitT/TauT family transport system ATP-binding protein/taurine transport system ATP-binding protein|nr:ABC transporter ATP-binding protein [Synergistaceae bacterium]
MSENGRTVTISLRNVTLAFRQNKRSSPASILEDIDFDIHDGDFICLLGPSGCGKTSLLNILAGYLPPTEGQITVGGKPLTGPNMEVGVVFQHPNLFPWLSVRKNVAFGLKYRNLTGAERRSIVDHYLDIVELTDFGDLLPYQLSGGMKQRAAIARTLAVDPKIVLLDEPFSALDAMTRERMQVYAHSIWERSGKSFFFITHDVDEALLLGNRIMVMRGGPGMIVRDIENPLRTSPHFSREIKRSQSFWAMRDSLLRDIENPLLADAPNACLSSAREAI